MMQLEDIKQVLVVGTGLMGHGIAQEFAQAGYGVVLNDLTDEQIERARREIQHNLEFLAEQGLGTAEQIGAATARIQGTTDLETASREADFVVEAVFEDLALKRRIFSALDEFCPQRTILTSNSSSLVPSSYASATRRPAQVLGAHYFEPAYLCPLVEVIKGPQTSDETVALTVELMKRVGKKPAIVHKEVPGFVGNRMQAALQREALSIVEQGIATPEDVDMIVRNGFGRRMGAMGPFEKTDLIGADLSLAVGRILIGEISRATEPSSVLIQQVETGKLGAKTGQGFYSWTPEKVESARRRIRRSLVRILQDEAAG